mgnify:CR=1 FL=1
MIQRMLSKALEVYENDIVVDAYKQENGITAEIRSFAVYDYLKGMFVKAVPISPHPSS